MGTSSIYERLNADLPGLKEVVDSLDRTLQTGDKNETRVAIKSVEAQGYFLARANPLCIFGKQATEGDISVRLLASGVNGRAKYEVLLEHNYTPIGYTPQSLLAPAGMPTDNYHLRCAQDAIVEDCRRRLKLDLLFKDGCLVLARRVDFGESLPDKVARFKRDLAKAKSYLADVAAQRADAA